MSHVSHWESGGRNSGTDNRARFAPQRSSGSLRFSQKDKSTLQVYSATRPSRPGRPTEDPLTPLLTHTLAPKPVVFQARDHPRQGLSHASAGRVSCRGPLARTVPQLVSAFAILGALTRPWNNPVRLPVTAGAIKLSWSRLASGAHPSAHLTPYLGRVPSWVQPHPPG